MSDTSSLSLSLARNDYPHGDAIWEHKKGRIWLIVQRQEREIRWLRYQNKILQARAKRVARV